MSKNTPLPAKGGSYVINKKGDLDQVAETKPRDLTKPDPQPASNTPSKED